MSKPPVPYLRECFTLDDATGKLFWRQRPVEHFKTLRDCNAWNTRFAGREAGGLDRQGYVRLGLVVNGSKKRIKAHRVIYALLNGEWPPHTIDHWNRDRADNRPDNLKPASFLEQQQNRSMQSNTSGLRGVSWSKRARRWQAQIAANRKNIHLGYFEDLALAHAAYLAAKAAHHTYRGVL